jgi:hypothetical protein
MNFAKVTYFFLFLRLRNRRMDAMGFGPDMHVEEPRIPAQENVYEEVFHQAYEM